MFKTILFKLKSLIQNLKRNFSIAHDDLGQHFLSSPFSFLFISTEASLFPIRSKIPWQPIYFFLFPLIFLAGPRHQVVRPSLAHSGPSPTFGRPRRRHPFDRPPLLYVAPLRCTARSQAIAPPLPLPSSRQRPIESPPPPLN
jgi:hypothetical protein